MSRIHGEQLAPVLKSEAETGNNYSRSHAAKVTLNQRNHIPFAVGYTEISRVALSELSVSGIVTERSFLHVN